MDAPSQTEIQEFCGGCDLLQSDGTCRLDRSKTRASDLQRTMLQRMFKNEVLGAALFQGVDISPEMVADLDGRVKGWTDQQRYVARKWCGWASVGGENGNMTDDGFQSQEEKKRQ